MFSVSLVDLVTMVSQGLSLHPMNSTPCKRVFFVTKVYDWSLNALL